MLADSLVGTEKAVFEADSLRKDVCLSFWETVDRFAEGLDGRDAF